MSLYGTIEAIQLPTSLDVVEGRLKKQLLNACAIHSNVQNDYIHACLLHKEAVKMAKTYELQANEALSKLQGVTANVKACMDMARDGAKSDQEKAGGVGKKSRKSQQRGEIPKLMRSDI